ncbi:hypothetical protein FQP34_17490 [Peribacillus simplex]|uniref:Uncharacterized protein n=1 Tax=Peribacillus simplex TaxID=1478 RepID=A0A8B5XWB8_9BACI|nr:hypothetical protein FQP34_17490 [Peribacillus simplex]
MIGVEGRDSCGKSESRGDPADAKRLEGSRTARGKRVPYVPINVRVIQTKKLQANSLFLEFVCSL